MHKLKSSIHLFLAFLLATLLLTGCKASSTNDRPPLKPRAVPDKPEHTQVDPLLFGGGIVVKFIEGSNVRLRNGKLTSLSNSPMEDVNKLFDQYPLTGIERQFTQPEEEIAAEQKQLEEENGTDVPDLNLYYRLILQNPADAEALIDGLNKLDIVELAYPETSPAPPP